MEVLFPSWDSIDEHKEVIKFAIRLSGESSKLLEVIYERLAIASRIEFFINTSEDFLKSLGKELPEHNALDTFHNRYFNFATEDNPILHIPSKYYVFKSFNHKIPDSGDIDYQINDSGDYSPAECFFEVQDNNTMGNVLEILQRIPQEIKVTKLMVQGLYLNPERRFPSDRYTCDDLGKSIKRTLKFSRNMGSFMIWDCYLSDSVFEHISQQLHGCDQLEYLTLIGTNQHIPLSFGDAISTMTSLRDIEVFRIQMTDASRCSLLSGLSRCTNLRDLSVSEVELTDNVHILFAGRDHPGFQSLETVCLGSSKLSRCDLLVITDAVDCHKLPQLKVLYLADNILSERVESLTSIGGKKYVLYPVLEVLDLGNTHLQSCDIKQLSQAIRKRKIPKLTTLNLGGNDLTNTITDLFGDPVHPAFSSFEELHLPSTGLQQKDITNLSRVMSSSKMTNCKTLNLSGNKLTGLFAELFDEAGLRHVQTLKLENTNLGKPDVTAISNAIEGEKVPRLSKLCLEKNSLYGLEEDIKHLYKTSIACVKQTTLNIHLTLKDVSEPKEFSDQFGAMCKGTMVSRSVDFY